MHSIRSALNKECTQKECAHSFLKNICSCLSCQFLSLHSSTLWCLIVQVTKGPIGRLQLDNFRIVNLGVGDHSNKERTFILQSFAVFGFQALNRVLPFLFQVLLVENFGCCPLVTLQNTSSKYFIVFKNPQKSLILKLFASEASYFYIGKSVRSIRRALNSACAQSGMR